MKAGKKRPCAYCGQAASTVDHVVSRALYPPSKATSRTPRITVPACTACNSGWTDDEPHFRNVLMVAGEQTPAVRELWQGKVWRSFHYADGYRRVRELAEKLEPVETEEGSRHMIYPARDARVQRVVRKIVRGLCHHHGLRSQVADDQVLVDIQRFAIPEVFLDQMTTSHAEADILTYRYAVLEEEGIHSCWLLTFYGRTPFFCMIFNSGSALQGRDVKGLRAS